jgi:hypothetical protein
MRLRYAGTCAVCRTALAARTTAVYSAATRSVRCVGCEATTSTEDVVVADEPTQPGVPPEVLGTGVAGASARRIYEQRKAERERRIREAHPRIGGLILALSDDPQSTRAWNGGALGEEKLGALLDKVGSPTIRVLHDRRIPRSRANIDHLAVCPSGVLVVDAKRYAGRRPTKKVEGGFFVPRRERLLVGGRDSTALVEGVQRQVAVVSDALADELSEPVGVRGFLCFVDAEWPLFGGDFTIAGVEVLWAKRLLGIAGAPGPLTEADVDRVARRLAAVFAPA